MVEDDDASIVETTPVEGGKADLQAPIVTETVVYAQARFENCQKDEINAEDLRKLDGILLHRDHLQKNMKRIDYVHYSTRSSTDQTVFHHTLDVRILVDVTRLWKNPRLYIWRHLGQYEWKMNGDTLVTLNRIHVK